MGDIKNLRTLSYSKSTRDYHIDHRVNVNEALNTLCTGQGGAGQSTLNIVEYEYQGQIYQRRLSINECERAMGYPVDWTKYGIDDDGDKYEIPIGARYMACGNGIVTTIPKFIIDNLVANKFPADYIVRVYSAFSGVDGSTMALDQNRFNKVAFNEFNPKFKKKQHAANILRYHYPGIRNFGDITKTNPQDIPDHDLAIISAPCQSFSQQGKRLLLEETRGTLFYNAASVLKEKRPRFFIFENVKGIVMPKTIKLEDGGKSFIPAPIFQVMDVFGSLGYTMDVDILNATNYGIAQNRDRVFIIGELIE